MNESEWTTRKQRIDTRLRALTPPWEIIWFLDVRSERPVSRQISGFHTAPALEASDELPEPQDLAGQALTELEAVVADLRGNITLLEREEGVEK